MIQKYEKEKGQTLIETVVALFVLTTGLTAGLSLAIYSFSTTTEISRKIIATGLAREGIEVARRQRDSNWLAGTLSDCGGQFCYATWLTNPNNTAPAAGVGNEYRMIFDPAGVSGKWVLSAAGPATDFRLYLHSGTGYLHTASSNPSPYFRKITMVNVDSSNPYSATSPLVMARSTVWWWDRGCPEATDPAATHCKVITEEYLTNWKNY